MPSNPELYLTMSKIMKFHKQSDLIILISKHF